ncbi:MAG: hypothetical protein DRP66_05130 [Planctomycetota bacterium]|nr:MAG: hypothetical protein DRP66_05130 [Planctomycetota bacterium]
MYYSVKRILVLFCAVGLLMGLYGCAPEVKEPEPEPEQPPNLDAAVGEFGELFQYSAVAVKGYGIVAGLPGTGSSECPPDLRQALVKYILRETGSGATVNPNKFIDSLDTAVVEIYGTIPPIAFKGDRFDIRVAAFSSTQTTSLAGGTLYPAELKEMSRLVSFEGYTAVLARAAGPVFINNLDGDKGRTSGYVLGGGTVVEGVKLAIGLYKPGFLAAAAVRNRINERFGPKTAQAISPGEIDFTIPAKYRNRKEQFLNMLRLLYLSDDGQLLDRRIDMLIDELVSASNKINAEHALEAIGRPTLDKLWELLASEDEMVRFHAARCMLSIGDDRALVVLGQFTREVGSPLRVPAIRAIGLSAERNSAIPTLAGLLDDGNFEVAFAAYQELYRLQDVSVSRTVVANKFFIDHVTRRGPKTIHVSREGMPRIVLFGVPIRCSDNIFVESEGKDIVINARPGEKYVSVMRRLANRPKLVGPLLAGRDVSDIIQALCGDPDVERRPMTRRGLGVSYSDIISLLSKMCDTGAVKADFVAGEMTTAGSFLENIGGNDR